VGIAAFVVLFLVGAVAIAYPLLPGTRARSRKVELTVGDIDQAVRELRLRQPESGPLCPACGAGYQPEDKFCARCGQTLEGAQMPEQRCPSCQAVVRAADQFCAACGQNLMVREGA